MFLVRRTVPQLIIQASIQAAIGWILFYHIVLRPLKIIPKDEHSAKRYEDVGLKPRFSYFEVCQSQFSSELNVIKL